jgi:polyphosphate kinase 2 (PPK2 family)
MIGEIVQMGEYKSEVDEMLLKTSTTNAPWTVAESNDKLYSGIKILKTVT